MGGGAQGGGRGGGAQGSSQQSSQQGGGVGQQMGSGGRPMGRRAWTHDDSLAMVHDDVSRHLRGLQKARGGDTRSSGLASSFTSSRASPTATGKTEGSRASVGGATKTGTTAAAAKGGRTKPASLLTSMMPSTGSDKGKTAKGGKGSAQACRRRLLHLDPRHSAYRRDVKRQRRLQRAVKGATGGISRADTSGTSRDSAVGAVEGSSRTDPSASGRGDPSGTGDPSSMEGGGMREADPCLDAYNAQLDSWFGGPSGGFNVDRWMNDFIGGYDTRDFEWEKDFLNDHRDSFGLWDMSDVDADEEVLIGYTTSPDPCVDYTLSIRPDYLLPSTKYLFRLDATDKDGVKVQTDIVVAVNGPPTSGFIDMSPAEGEVFATGFEFSAGDWVDPENNYPLKYSFFIMNSPRVWCEATDQYCRKTLRSDSFESSYTIGGGEGSTESIQVGLWSCGVIVMDALGDTMMQLLMFLWG